MKAIRWPTPRKFLGDRGMTLAAASYQGGLLLSQGEQRKAHFDHFKKRLDLCQQLAIPTLVGRRRFCTSPTVTDLERALVSLAQAAHWAAAFDMRLALEFRGKSTFCSSLETASGPGAPVRRTERRHQPGVFHYYTGPSKFEDLAHLTADRLALVQVCDLAGVPRELATDGDRILPGDGDLQLEPIIQFLRQIHYDGWISLELMNPTLWQTSPALVADMGLTALRKLMMA